jgi:hypothetical protein
MRAGFPGYLRALYFIIPVAALLLSPGCRRVDTELPIIPPVTRPLAGRYIGFGVVKVSFAHLLSEPGRDGVSQGYLRRGTVVRIIERRSVLNRGSPESWILAEGNYQGEGSAARGWIEEAGVEIYGSEPQANTASKATDL